MHQITEMEIVKDAETRWKHKGLVIWSRRCGDAVRKREWRFFTHALHDQGPYGSARDAARAADRLLKEGA
jgi:hypothetical protein